MTSCYYSARGMRISKLRSIINVSSIIYNLPLSFLVLFKSDEPGTASEGKVRPGPLKESDEAVAETNQEVDMHGEPHEPREQACEMQPPHIYDGIGTAHRCQVSLVVVVQWRMLLL